MNIRGLPSYVRQPSRNKSQEQQLILTYPVLIDETVKKYENDIRDFIAVSFLNNIKVSNFLHITSTIVKDESQTKDLNPAEFLYTRLNNKNLGELEQQTISYLKSISTQSDIMKQKKQQEYQNFIYEKLAYIKQILEHDNIMSKLRPHFTLITIDKEYGIITLPMIIGTKQFYTDLNMMYWILLVALSRNIKLNRQEAIETVDTLLDYVNPTNYYFLLFTEEGQEKLSRMSGIQVGENINATTAREIQRQFQENYKKFERAFAIISEDVIIKQLHDWFKESLPDVVNAVNEIKNQIMNLANEVKDTTLYKAAMKIKDILIPDLFERKKVVSIYAAEQLKELIQDESKKTLAFFKKCLDRVQWDRYVGVNSGASGVIDVAINSVKPEIELIINKSINMFHSFVTTNVSQTILLAAYASESNIQPIDIERSISNSLKEIVDSGYNHYINLWNIVTETLRQMFENANIRNIDLSDNLKSLELLDHMKLDDSSKEIQDLVAFNFSNQSIIFQSPENFIAYINNLSKLSTDFKQRNDQLKKILIDSFLYNNITINNQLSKAESEFTVIITKLFNDLLPLGNVGSLADHPMFNMLFKTYPDQSKLQLLSNCKLIMQSAIGQMTYYFFLLSFISYINETIKIVNVKLDIIKRDATDFPNYCIVLPYYLIEGFYHAKVAGLFKRVLYSNDPTQVLSDLKLSGGVPKINEQDSKKIVNYIVGLLDIPNIILIDTKTDSLYYKFMFMDGCQKIKLTTLQTYIKSQKEILNL